MRDAREPASLPVEPSGGGEPAPAPAIDPTAEPTPTRTPGEVVAPSMPPPVEIRMTPDLADSVARYRGADPGEREAALFEISGSGEPGALEFLLDELPRSQGEERRKLLQAVIDFGSRDAIPKLRELAQASDDPEQRTALVEAADYLALPTLKEFRERRGAEGAAP